MLDFNGFFKLRTFFHRNKYSTVNRVEKVKPHFTREKFIPTFLCFLSPTAIPSESHHQTETSPCPAAVNGGQNGHGQAEETQVATPSVPVNGTNGNGKHHTSDDEEAETAAAKSISNGSSEKQENGTTKVRTSQRFSQIPIQLPQ